MRIYSFQVWKYRSIIESKSIIIGDHTVLIGPNNEGKTNLINALMLSLNMIKYLPKSMLEYHNSIMLENYNDGVFNSIHYDWDEDYPILLKNNNKYKKTTSFKVTFKINDEEAQELYNMIGMRIVGNIPVSITINNKNTIEYKIVKQGLSRDRIKQNEKAVTKFISSKLDFRYIPAIRTEKQANQVINFLVMKEIETLNKDEEVLDAFKIIKNKIGPLLDDIANGLNNTIQAMIPQVVDVKIKQEIFVPYKSMDVKFTAVINDGVNTTLNKKGDGIKSLTALGMMKLSAEKRAGKKNLILAIEEPESHLHPSLIHRVKDVLYELSNNHQIILTTHSPSLVNRKRIKSNILVCNNSIAIANDIKEIRELLGVPVYDNLYHADTVLLVEGEDDKIALQPILKYMSSVISEAINTGRLYIRSMHGCTNIKYYLSLHDSLICNIHVFLDGDEAGKMMLNEAVESLMIKALDYNMVKYEHANDIELEDLYNIETYRQKINDMYGVTFHRHITRMQPKWSERMRLEFIDNGKDWDDSIKKEVKVIVAECVAASPSTALDVRRQGCIKSLVKSLEKKLAT